MTTPRGPEVDRSAVGRPVRSVLVFLNLRSNVVFGPTPCRRVNARPGEAKVRELDVNTTGVAVLDEDIVRLDVPA